MKPSSKYPVTITLTKTALMTDYKQFHNLCIRKNDNEVMYIVEDLGRSVTLTPFRYVEADYMAQLNMEGKNNVH